MPESGQESQVQFTIDEQIYQSDQFFPENISKVEETKIIRGCPTTILWITPV